ncbi:hypothetical protein [Pseudanabaena sp. FACHB-2040]|nr:hypothetical protein [Pseudanabaena sp. FACHB-2040]
MFQPPDSGAQPPTVSAGLSPRRDKARIAVYESLVACDSLR